MIVGYYLLGDKKGYKNHDRNNRKDKTPDINNSNMCNWVCWGAINISFAFLTQRTTDWFLVSTMLGIVSGHRIGVYDWFMEDEKMGCLYLYRLCSSQPGCFTCNGNLELHGSADTSSIHIFGSEKCFKNDITNLPHKGIG